MILGTGGMVMKTILFGHSYQPLYRFARTGLWVCNRVFGVTTPALLYIFDNQPARAVDSIQSDHASIQLRKCPLDIPLLSSAHQPVFRPRSSDLCAYSAQISSLQLTTHSDRLSFQIGAGG